MSFLTTEDKLVCSARLEEWNWVSLIEGGVCEYCQDDMGIYYVGKMIF